MGNDEILTIKIKEKNEDLFVDVHIREDKFYDKKVMQTIIEEFIQMIDEHRNTIKI